MILKPGVRLIEDIQGVGSEVKNGDTLKVRLNGWLSKGKKIQNNVVVHITLGTRIVIPGIEYAIEGMKKHGRRKVKISPHLGYKEEGVKNLIPPNALLIYEIEIINVNDG